MAKNGKKYSDVIVEIKPSKINFSNEESKFKDEYTTKTNDLEV